MMNRTSLKCSLLGTLTFLGVGACYTIEPSGSLCGTARESQHTFNCGQILAHPTWIEYPAAINVCTTDFEGAGFDGCSNTGTNVFPVRETFWCENGHIQSSVEQISLGCLSAQLSGDPCQGQPEG